MIDEIIQNHFPTVMMPKQTDLPELETGKTRLIMADDGVYIETCQLWGKIIRQLWSSPRKLPYGSIVERNDLQTAIAQVEGFVATDLIEKMAENAKVGMEWAGWITYKKPDFRYRELPSISIGAAHVKSSFPLLHKGECLAIDIHSHGNIPAFFSKTDDIDDAGGVKVSIVYGGYKNNEFTEEARRICIEGFFFEM